MKKLGHIFKIEIYKKIINHAHCSQIQIILQKIFKILLINLVLYMQSALLFINFIYKNILGSLVCRRRIKRRIFLF